VNLLDAAALIAFLRDEPARSQVEAMLRDGGAAISAVNLAEVADQLSRRRGLSPVRVQGVLSGLVEGNVDVLAFTEAHAFEAGALRARHYHRRDAPLSLGDCALLASALAVGATVVTSDRALLRVAHSEALEIVVLPDSTGRRARRPPTA
jgi:PIN domain nuclease of toxin-antitoxin system